MDAVAKILGGSGGTVKVIGGGSLFSALGGLSELLQSLHKDPQAGDVQDPAAPKDLETYEGRLAKSPEPSSEAAPATTAG